MTIKDYIITEIAYYSNLWSGILFWLGIVIACIHEDTGLKIVGISLLILCIRLINSKIATNSWTAL